MLQGCRRRESWLAARCCGPFKRRAASRFPIVHQADYSSSPASAATSSQLIRRIPSAGKRKQALPVCSDQRANMDFNVKKLASDAGVFFTRAVQVSRRSILLDIRVADRAAWCMDRFTVPLSLRPAWMEKRCGPWCWVYTKHSHSRLLCFSKAVDEIWN